MGLSVATCGILGYQWMRPNAPIPSMTYDDCILRNLDSRSNAVVASAISKSCGRKYGRPVEEGFYRVEPTTGKVARCETIKALPE